MVITRIAALALLGLFLACSSAQADLSISIKPTQNMSCKAGVCTATAKKAVLNVGDLTGMLASGDAKISAGRAVNIKLLAALTWVSEFKLTLYAPSGAITFEQPITVAGRGSISLETQPTTGGLLSFTKRGRIAFWDLNSQFSLNDLFFKLVGNIAQLASEIAGNPSGAFALANDYDASVDGTFASAPISTTFTGTLEGLGNTISHLGIFAPTSNQRVGLFAYVNFGTIADFGLAKASVAGGSGSDAYVGALAGYGTEFSSDALRSWATGTVVGGDAARVGGLFGAGGADQSHFVGKVTGGVGV